MEISSPGWVGDRQLTRAWCFVEGVGNTEEARFYLGKRVAFVYRAQKERRGSKIRVIWGKVTRPHGSHCFLQD